MKFLDKESNMVLYLEIEQDLEMWNKGFIAFHVAGGDWLQFRAMKDVTPYFVRKGIDSIVEKDKN